VEELLGRISPELRTLVRDQPVIRWGQPTTLNPTALSVNANGTTFGQLTDLGRQQAEEDERDDVLYVNRGALTILDEYESAVPRPPTNDLGQRISAEALGIGASFLNDPNRTIVTNNRIQAIVNPATGEIVRINTDAPDTATNGRVIVDAAGRLGVAFDPPDLAKATKVRLEKNETGALARVDDAAVTGTVTVTDAFGTHTSYVFEATQVFNPATGRDMVFIDPTIAAGIGLLANSGDFGEKGLVVYQGGLEIVGGVATGDVTKIGKGVVDIAIGLTGEELEDRALIAFTKVVPSWVGRAVTFLASDLGMVLIGWQVGTEIHHLSDAAIEYLGGPGAIQKIAQLEDQRNREDVVLGGLYQRATGTETQNVLIHSATEQLAITTLGRQTGDILQQMNSGVAVVRKDGSGIVDIIDANGRLVRSMPIGETTLPNDTQYATIGVDAQGNPKLDVTRRGEATADAPLAQTWGAMVYDAVAATGEFIGYGLGTTGKGIVDWVDHTAVGGALLDMGRNIGTSVGWLATGVGNVAGAAIDVVKQVPGAVVNGLADNVIAPAVNLLTLGTAQPVELSGSVQYAPKTAAPPTILKGANLATLSDDGQTITFYYLDANGGRQIGSLPAADLHLPGNLQLVYLKANGELSVSTSSGNTFIYTQDQYKVASTAGGGAAGASDEQNLPPARVADIVQQLQNVIVNEARHTLGNVFTHKAAVLKALESQGVDVANMAKITAKIEAWQKDPKKFVAANNTDGKDGYQVGDIYHGDKIITAVNANGQPVGWININQVVQEAKELLASQQQTTEKPVEPPARVYLLADGTTTTERPENGVFVRDDPVTGITSYIQVTGAVTIGTRLTLASGESIQYNNETIIGDGTAGSLIQLPDGQWTNLVVQPKDKVLTSNGDVYKLVDGKLTRVEVGEYALDAAVGVHSPVAGLDQLQLDALTLQGLEKLQQQLADYQTKLETLAGRIRSNDPVAPHLALAKQRVASLLNQLSATTETGEPDWTKLSGNLRWNPKTGGYESVASTTTGSQSTMTEAEFIDHLFSQGTIDYIKFGGADGLQAFQIDQIPGTDLYRVVGVSADGTRLDQSVSATVLKNSGLQVTIGEGTAQTIVGRTINQLQKNGIFSLGSGQLVLDMYREAGNPASLVETRPFQKFDAQTLLSHAQRLNETLATASSLNPLETKRQADGLAKFITQQLLGAQTDAERQTYLEALGQANQASGRSVQQAAAMVEAARQEAALAARQRALLSDQLSLVGDGSVPVELEARTNPTINLNAVIGDASRLDVTISPASLNAIIGDPNRLQATIGPASLQAVGTEHAGTIACALQVGGCGSVFSEPLPFVVTPVGQPSPLASQPIDLPSLGATQTSTLSPDQLAQQDGYVDAAAKVFALSAGTITETQYQRLG
ncbi:hypothetical protein HY523_02395, partial [Candidatus Berkelbacteria bacterium]|nr:hypothetical protein [Candidatus Berkelbacteria bacterium]